MTLSELFSASSLEKFAQPCSCFSGRRAVASITCDSRQVMDGSIFVCITGSLNDGHDYIKEAQKRGAQLIVVQKDCKIKNQLIVPDTRKAYSELCSAYFGHPAQKLHLLGVTGTNGKTTVTWLLHHALNQMGVKTGLVGTVYNDNGEEMFPSSYTTPDAWQLQRLFAQMADSGCTYGVVEVSSQALDQQRLWGCHFDCAAFTNLSPEHLDYHHDLENYYQAKKKLFSLCDRAAVNLENPFGKRLNAELEAAGREILSFGITQTAQLRAQAPAFFCDRCEAVLTYQGKKQKAKLSMPGKFSIENLLTAAAVLISCGFDFAESVKALCSCSSVPGRTEVCLSQDGITVLRDYAHTPDSLQKVLSSIKEFCGGKLITVFGCPGRRDRAKRPLMTQAVCRYSDVVFLTADNPREEDLQQIFADALAGSLPQREKIIVTADRKEAICQALTLAKPKDTILLAGKGHENYQVLKERTVFFDEKQLVNDLYPKCKTIK